MQIFTYFHSRYTEPEFKLANVFLKAGNGLCSVGMFLSDDNNNEDEQPK